MPSARALLLLCGAVVLGAGCEDPAPAPPPARPAAGATLAVAATLRGPVGSVTVKRAAGDDWIPASEGMRLYEDDKVRTMLGARAVVHFADGDDVTLGEDGLYGISERHPRPGQDRSDVHIVKGRISVELQDASRQGLLVTTPAATIRGGREINFQ